MKTYYLASAQYMQEQEDGLLKQVTDLYLVPAVSFTDAESITYKFLEKTVSGEFRVKNIRKTNIAEVVNKESDYFFQVKVKYTTVDGDSGKEVTINSVIIVGVQDVESAIDMVKTHLTSMLIPYRITEVKETKILEVVESED